MVLYSFKWLAYYTALRYINELKGRRCLLQKLVVSVQTFLPFSLSKGTSLQNSRHGDLIRLEIFLYAVLIPHSDLQKFSWRVWINRKESGADLLCVWKCKFMFYSVPILRVPCMTRPPSLVCFSYSSACQPFGVIFIHQYNERGGNRNSPAEIFDNYSLEQEGSRRISERQMQHFCWIMQRFSF
jgi:hypothetical protein